MRNRHSLSFEGQGGHFDGVFQGCMVGWAWNPLTPHEPVYVDLYINGELYKTVKADQFREDLLEFGVGNGTYGFMSPIESENLGSTYIISARLSGTSSELLNSPMWISNTKKLEPKAHLTTFKIDPHNIAFSLENLDAAKIDHLLIDINDTCNADCVYCPNTRTKKRIELDQFQTLLDRCIEQVDILQIGCAQEPTADSRLSEFYKVLNNSTLRPKRLTMISNATLLHRHEISFFRECGLSDLQISLDTVDPEINAMTRRGTEISRIIKNLQDVREKCPDMGVIFSVVVNSMTIDGVEALIEFGDSLGVSQYYLREIFDHFHPTFSPRNEDYREWMPKITLKPGEFQNLQERLSQHPSFNKMTFISAEGLASVRQDMQQSDRMVRVS